MPYTFLHTIHASIHLPTFPPQAKAFYTWLDHVQWRKRMRVVMDRTAKRMRNSGLARAWDAWRSAVENSKIDFHMTKKEELAVRSFRTAIIILKPIVKFCSFENKITSVTYQVQVKALSEENERLRRDNERFVRLIDSGEWGRGRVAELVSAGEVRNFFCFRHIQSNPKIIPDPPHSQVLKGERDALMKLIQSMRKEYEAVQGAKGAQEDELRRLKERMLLGVRSVPQ